MGSYGFGLVGAGLIADFHARAIGEIEGATVTAVADVDEARGNAMAQKYDATFHKDFRDLAGDPKVDIVNVCTPSGLHAEPALAAIEAGKHVIVEKPLEVTLERCDSIIEKADQAGVGVGVIFPSRFSDASTVTRKAIDDGRLGRITLADAYVKWYRTQEYYDRGGWRGTWKLDGGGALMNQSIHAIDLLNWFAGPVETVQAFTGTLSHERIEVEDTAVAVLRFASGALGVIEGTTSAYPGFLKKLEISGSQGSIIMEEGALQAWAFEEARPEDDDIRERFAPKTSKGGAADPADIGHEGHRRQIVDFIEALEQKRAPLVDGPEGRKAVEIILAIYESARTGQPVALPLK